MENINLEQYKVFYLVAKNKNITKTSKELLISQPAITQTIKKLEGEIGYSLFFRTKKGMELTEEGEILFSYIKDSIECLNDCKGRLDRLNQRKEIVIRIGGGTTLLKHNALEGFQKFKKKYPSTKIEIKKDITKNLLQDLLEDRLDMVFLNMPVADIPKDKIKIISIEEVQDAFLADSSTFSNLKDKEIDSKELENLPFVLQSEFSSSRKYLDSLCNKNKIHLQQGYELHSYELVIEFVKVGLGLGFINKNHVKEELKNEKLLEIKTNFQIPKREIGIAIPKKYENNEYLKEFIQMIKKKK